MILTSTLRKLGTKPIYQVSVPMHRVQAGSISHIVPAYHDYFTTKAAAEKAVQEMLEFAAEPVAATVTSVQADTVLTVMFA